MTQLCVHYETEFSSEAFSYKIKLHISKEKVFYLKDRNLSVKQGKAGKYNSKVIIKNGYCSSTNSGKTSKT